VVIEAVDLDVLQPAGRRHGACGKVVVQAIDDNQMVSGPHQITMAVSVAEFQRPSHVAFDADLAVLGTDEGRERPRGAGSVIDLEQRVVRIDPARIPAVGDSFDGIRARAEQVGQQRAISGPHAHAAGAVVLFSHPDLPQLVDRDAGGPIHAQRVEPAYRGPPARLEPSHKRMRTSKQVTAFSWQLLRSEDGDMAISHCAHLACCVTER